VDHGIVTGSSRPDHVPPPLPDQGPGGPHQLLRV